MSKPRRGVDGAKYLANSPMRIDKDFVSTDASTCAHTYTRILTHMNRYTYTKNMYVYIYSFTFLID